MFSQLLAPLLISTAGIITLGAVLNVIGANIYDLQLAKQRRERQRHPRARRLRPRPLITVIVPTQNDEQTIENCLNSICKSSYRKLEIIIVDNVSTDNTLFIVNRFIADHAKRSIRLVAKRTPGERRAASLAAYRKYGSGELVMILDAGSRLEPQTLTNAVAGFNQNDTWSIVEPALSMVSNFRLSGLFQIYLNFMNQRAKKSASLRGRQYAFHDQSIYKRQTFLDFRQSQRAHYANDVVLSVIPRRFKQLLTENYYQQRQRLNSLFGLIHGLAALSVPFMLCYLLYLAASLHEPTLLATVIGLVSVFLLAAIWDSQQATFRQKISYSLGIPLTYGLLFVLSFVQIFVILSAAIRSKRPRLSLTFFA